MESGERWLRLGSGSENLKPNQRQMESVRLALLDRECKALVRWLVGRLAHEPQFPMISFGYRDHFLSRSVRHHCP